MIFVISSAFVQITFGLRQHKLKYFKDIYISPGSYRYKHVEELYDGDVNPHTKMVNMSWPAVEKGFQIPDDALNLSVHEFGHCIILENSRRSAYSRFFKERDFTNWRQRAGDKMLKIQAKKNVLLRDYAGTNLIELFSVSLEHFFEKPEEFHEKEPQLYKSMVNLLNQDPRKREDPRLKRR